MYHIYWTAFRSLLRKEIKRFTRIWVQTLVPPAITMSLYFIIFGNLIGSRIGQMNGFSYMEYIVPGLIMMSVITNSYSNVASSFFSAKFQKNIEELLVAPVPNYVIIAGYVMGGVTRGLLVGAMVTFVSLFFVDLSVDHWGIITATVFLTSVVFSLGGLINAVYARTFDDISIIPTFVLTPLTYLGGILLHQSAAGVLAGRIENQPHRLHGERVPLRLPGCLGCGYRDVIQRAGCVCGGAVRRGPLSGQ
ncbi:ABC transporter permease [Vibrio fluvialis]|nr:ABC transporter permease [Vibrio fluvialis]WMN55051.1 ABC transporter permease [Vibrio fluvialis]